MSWSTHDEYEYVKHLGSHSAAGTRNTKADLLHSYLTTMKERSNWERIDKTFIENCVLDLISMQTNKSAKRHNVI